MYVYNIIVRSGISGRQWSYRWYTYTDVASCLVTPRPIIYLDILRAAEGFSILRVIRYNNIIVVAHIIL